MPFRVHSVANVTINGNADSSTETASEKTVPERDAEPMGTTNAEPTVGAGKCDDTDFAANSSKRVAIQ